MTDDSTERVGSSFVASSLTVTSSSEGAETSSPWRGEGAWVTGLWTDSWSLFVARGAVTNAFPEGDESFKAPSLEAVSLSEGAPVVRGFWASGSGILWVSFGEFEGDSVASLELSEGLGFFPETAQ